jgi:hypothetical protein
MVEVEVGMEIEIENLKFELGSRETCVLVLDEGVSTEGRIDSGSG